MAHACLDERVSFSETGVRLQIPLAEAYRRTGRGPIACKRAGIEFNNSEAHSAAYDALKTAELFCCIVNRWQQLGGWQWPELAGDPE